MKSIQCFGLLGAGFSLLVLSACSSTQTTSTNSPAASPSVATSQAAAPIAGDKPSKEGNHSEAQAGGQVIEAGQYHLEFVPEKEAELSHLDFYLFQGETHTPVPNAKVTAQVKLPDGSHLALAMAYDPADKHYTAKLPGAAAGTYKVAILSDIKGEKVNGRFSFSR